MSHDHSGHGGHGGDGGHDMPAATCQLNMLWNTQIIDTCIVFPGWHISSTSSFIFSCIVIVALGVLYEYLRLVQKSFDARLAASLSKGKGRDRSRSRENSPSRVEEHGLLTGRPVGKAKVAVPPISRAIRAILYGITVFLSFFLMLVFMTYNAYLIIAVVLGAAIGHYTFGATLSLESTDGNGMACH